MPSRIALGRVATAVGAFLIVAQVFRPARVNPPGGNEVPAPSEVRTILRGACYDCHSNETIWPWYSQVAPVSWLVAYDVREGREELNFSEWGGAPPAKRQKKLKETIETVNQGEMPPWYYVLMHPDARLADADRTALVRWAEASRGGM